MATIEKRTDKNGSTSYRVKIRKRGQSASETFSRLTDARQWATKTEAAIDENRFASSKARRHTVVDMVELYLEEKLPGKKSAKDTKRHLLWWKKQIGHHKLSGATPDLRADTLRKLKRGRTPATVNRYRISISAAFSATVKDWHWLQSNPMHEVRKPDEPKGRIRFLSDDERAALLKACRESKSPHLYPIVVLALSTGMRQGEILGLTWEAVDLKSGHVTLFDTKNGETRGVPVVGVALDLLTEHAKVRRIDTPLVFPSTKGSTPINFRQGWLSAVEAAGIEDFRFHDLRHTAASHLAMSGATLAEIAEILGHKTLAMVKRYSHLFPRRL